MTNPPTMTTLALSLLLAGSCGDDSDGGSADGDSMTGTSGVSGTTSGGGGTDSQAGGTSGEDGSAATGAEAGAAASGVSGGDGSAASGAEAGAGAGASGAGGGTAGGGGGDNAPSGYPPDMPLDASLTSCSDSGQCVVVELGCCDACNGGLAVAVNRESMADVTSRFSEQCDGPTICTLRGCAPWVATCVDGSCDLGQGML